MRPQPTNKDNFLIEVTPEQLDELRAIYRHVDDEGYVEMHYSPYWERNKHIGGIELTGVDKVNVIDAESGKLR
jgi:hypothetical protein